MRPLLASLALLLLALCRSSSAAFESFGELVNKPLQDSFNNDADIMSVIAAVNSLLSNKDIDFKDAMNNGVACAMTDLVALEGNLKKAMYGTEVANPDEAELAKEIGLDCANTAQAATDPGKCFCTDGKVLAFCASLKYKDDKIKDLTVAPGNCKKGALAALKLKGTKQLGEEYEIANLRKDHEFLLENLPKLHDADIVDVITKNSNVEELKFFCDATDPDAATALETLFKSDLAYPKIDADFAKKVLFYVANGKMPNENEKEYDDLMAAANDEFKADCAKPEFASEPFVKCICERTKGLLYCVYNAIGVELKKDGYLKCDATPAVDATKKPATVAPAYLKPKPPKTTTAAAAAPNVTTTEAATGAAAAASLPLAAAAAAAAALLLLR